MANGMRQGAGRGVVTAMAVALIVGFGALGYGVARASDGLQWRQPGPTAVAEPSPAPPRTPRTTPATTPAPTPAPAPAPSPVPSPPPPPPAARVLLQPGDNGAEVREVQARLRQIDWFEGDVTDHYGEKTTAAVRGFQAKRGFPVTGKVDEVTLKRLHEMTREPSSAELENRITPMGNAAGPLDQRCLTGRVLCVDKSSRTLRWVVDGKVVRTVDVRFGSQELPTREGSFSVQRKSRDHVSSLYDTPMPYAMFFSGGQAVHYSPDFAAQGYSGASHGCVNVRDLSAIRSLFDEVVVGDRVVVYWS